jgi:SAM-dependent methyltransferase
MTETYVFQATLRSEYDPAVLDGAQRAQLAQRLHMALCDAGLWPAQARLLDVGCGSGLLLSALGHDVRQRIGCDLRRELYVQVRPHVAQVAFAQADGLHLPFPDACFDLVTCMAVMGEFPDWPAALHEMARCVAPGGVLYVTITHGRLLLPLFGWLERLGYRVAHSQWDYARASLRPVAGRPEAGFGVAALAGWRYVHLTPHLARSQWPWLHALPYAVLDRVLRRCAPSFGHAWQRQESNAL